MTDRTRGGLFSDAPECVGRLRSEVSIRTRVKGNENDASTTVRNRFIRRLCLCGGQQWECRGAKSLPWRLGIRWWLGLATVQQWIRKQWILRLTKRLHLLELGHDFRICQRHQRSRERSLFRQQASLCGPGNAGRPGSAASGATGTKFHDPKRSRSEHRSEFDPSCITGTGHRPDLTTGSDWRPKISARWNY